MNRQRVPRPLTQRQKTVWEYIAEQALVQGYPPTIREIGFKFGIKSTNGVRSLLSALETKGAIKRQPFLSRGIEILKWPEHLRQPEHAKALNVTKIPIVGRVAAGTPILAEENIEGEIIMDRSLFPSGDGFALRVAGQSMVDAGIRDGDIVLARPDLPLEIGSIVVALIGEEATVKYYHPESSRVRLEPANTSYGPIIIENGTPDFKVVGRVVGLYRRY